MDRHVRIFPDADAEVVLLDPRQRRIRVGIARLVPLEVEARLEIPRRAPVEGQHVAGNLSLAEFARGLGSLLGRLVPGARDPQAEAPLRNIRRAAGELRVGVEDRRRCVRREDEEVERLVVDQDRVRAVRPVGTSDTVGDHAGRVHEHAPCAPAVAGAPGERNVLVRMPGVDAERVDDLRMDDLAALVERTEFLAETVHGSARGQRHRDGPLVALAHAAEGRQPGEAAKMLVGGRAQHLRAAMRQPEFQRRARDLEHGIPRRECDRAVFGLRDVAGLRLTDDEPVVGPRVGAHAQPEHAGTEAGDLQHVARRRRERGTGSRRADALGCVETEERGRFELHGDWSSRSQPANFGSGKPGHVDTHGKDSAGLRQSRELAGVAVLPRRGHVERPKIVAPERAHRRALRGQRILGQDRARGREAHDLAAAIERDPVAAVAVDRGAVGAVGLAFEPGEHAGARRRPGDGVEVVRADRERRRVGVIHRASVGTPREAVADRHAVQDGFETAAGFDAEERAARRIAALVHRTGPKTALSVAASVVEAVMRRIVRCVGELLRQRPVRAREPDAAAQRHDEPARGTQRETADRLGHRHRDVGRARGIEAIERRRVDVDPVERAFLGRPHRAFAEIRLRVVHAGECRGCEVGERCHGGCTGETHRTRNRSPPGRGAVRALPGQVIAERRFPSSSCARPTSIDISEPMATHV